MATNVTYDYLWGIYQKEKQTNQLLPIPRSFYSDARAFISKLGSSGEAAAGTKNNSINLLNGLFEKRRQKILVYIAYGKQLPQPVSDQEQELYNRLIDLLKVNKLDSANIRAAEKVPLRSLKDIPEVILPSGGRAGPLRKGQTIEIESGNGGDIEFLISNALCERM